MDEKEWLKQAITLIMKSSYTREKKVIEIMKCVEAYEAMKEI